MYTIIGGDGREYGPVSADQIRQWIGAGRANLETQAKAAGTDEWRPLGDFPEFQPGAAAAAAPPALGAAPAAAARFDPLEAFSQRWAALRGPRFWPAVGVTAVMAVLWALPWVVIHALYPDLTTLDLIKSANGRGATRWIYLAVSLLISQPAGAGYVYYFMRLARAEEARLKHLFAGFGGVYPKLVVLLFAVGLLETIGFFLLILPGVYLLVAYSLAAPALVDRRCGIWTAMELSRRSITRRWWSFLLLLILGGLLIMAGAMCFGVGALIAAPLATGAMSFAYLSLFP